MSRAFRFARGALRRSATAKSTTASSEGFGSMVKSTSTGAMTPMNTRSFGGMPKSASKHVLHGVRDRLASQALGEELRVGYAMRRYAAGSKVEEDEREHESGEEGEEIGQAGQHRDELAQLRAELEEKDAKVKDINDRLLRTLAEMENLRERMRRQAEDAKKFAIQGFCKDLLDVADNLDRAIATVANMDEEKDIEKVKNALKSFTEGVVLTEKVLDSKFRKNDVVKFNPLGEEFDANIHMALFNVPIPAGSDAKAGQVAAVTKVGYTLADRVIRAAEVGVYR